jgi:hypothetical protein
VVQKARHCLKLSFSPFCVGLQRFFPLKKSLIMERKNIELASNNEMDTIANKVRHRNY